MNKNKWKQELLLMVAVTLTAMFFYLVEQYSVALVIISIALGSFIRLLIDIFRKNNKAGK